MREESIRLVNTNLGLNDRCAMKRHVHTVLFLPSHDNNKGVFCLKICLEHMLSKELGAGLCVISSTLSRNIHYSHLLTTGHVVGQHRISHF